MALAPRRQVVWTDVDFALNVAQERGVVLCIVAGTTADGEVALANPTGLNVTPVGVLLDDIEDLNFDRHGEYLQRNVSDIGSVVGLAVKADLDTDQITGTPVAGDKAYLNANGTVSPTQLLDGVTGQNAPQVGVFRSAPNANGFARVHFDL